MKIDDGFDELDSTGSDAPLDCVCPYCLVPQGTEDKLLAHMPVCEMMEF